MHKSEELESSMAGPLSAALVAIAIFSLTVMTLVDTPRQNYVEEVFMVLGLASLLSAARIIDTTFDKIALNVSDRFRMIGGGYFLFCCIVGAMSFSIMLLYATKTAISGFSGITLTPALLTGLCITSMLMSHRGSEVWFVAIVVFAGIFWITLSFI